ncbi:MAG TPA: hypothetical protein VHS99_17430 [Chloroflexota bacterium]|nr:hypothetical protein [Chloroflexota bacterium]
MSPPDPTLAAALLALAVAPFLLVLSAALIALRRPLPWGGSLILGAAAGCAAAELVLAHVVPLGSAAFDVPLFTWSPLGLYGVTIGVRPSPAAAMLMLPPLVMGAAAWIVRARADRRLDGGAPSFGRRAAGDAASLTGLAGALWTALAADLVSQYLGVMLFLLATVAVLWAVARTAPAGRRLVLTTTTGTTLLACVLILGKVNGHFLLSQLSTAGFTSTAFFGCALGAAIAAPSPPFHRWLLRISRHPFSPLLAAAGTAVALAVLLMAFRTTAGELAPNWQRGLTAFGWLATLVTAGVVTVRRAPTVRLAALFAGKASLIFLAMAIATPGSLAAALLYASMALPAFGLLWFLLVLDTRSPMAPSITLPTDPGAPPGATTPGGRYRALGGLAAMPAPQAAMPAPHEVNGQSGEVNGHLKHEANGASWRPQGVATALATRAPTAQRTPVSPRLHLVSVAPADPRQRLRRSPSFWLLALLLASAAGLPGTVGGVANSALVTALTSWPSGDLTLRVPPAVLDAMTLAIGGSLLWNRRRRRLLDGRWGWLLLALAASVLVGPALLPNQLIGQWFGLPAAVATGTGSAPLRFDLARFPPVLSTLLGLVAVWSLVQRLRGREWLPGVARAVLGTAALVWVGAYRAWRRQEPLAGLSADTLFHRLQGGADRLMAVLRLLEERYYAAAAIVAAVALIYFIGR